jgi:hypothetical protein
MIARPSHAGKQCSIGPHAGFRDDLKDHPVPQGNLGYPVGKNILKGGHALVVHDLNRATADKLIERGATWALLPMEAGATN